MDEEHEEFKDSVEYQELMDILISPRYYIFNEQNGMAYFCSVTAILINFT